MEPSYPLVIEVIRRRNWGQVSSRRDAVPKITHDDQIELGKVTLVEARVSAHQERLQVHADSSAAVANDQNHNARVLSVQ